MLTLLARLKVDALDQNMPSGSSIIFVDRDGTINEDFGYVCRPDDLRLLPGAALALGTLVRAGYRIVIVTNQSAVGRGYATIEAVHETNNRLLSVLRTEDKDAVVSEVLVCPHHPDDRCPCRKPLAGLITQLSSSFDPLHSWVVGDKDSDVKFGENIGLPPEHRLLITQHPVGSNQVLSLWQAAERIIKQ